MQFNFGATGTTSDHLPFFPAAPHRVLELFAGVGGFHHGLEQVNQQRQAAGLPRAFEVVWANQWEPGCKKQHAAGVYAARWGQAPVNRNLFDVLDDDAELARIDALAPTMLVGGFPCQDYSVAKPASQSEGLEGKKGVLWWGIHRLLQMRIAAGQPIQQLMLENVDRLINSPSKCRGRDFAIILSSLETLGYAVAWQVVNAAHYGFAQKRKRVFIVAVHASTAQYQQWTAASVCPAALLTQVSPLAQGLPVDLNGAIASFSLGADILDTQENYAPTVGGKSRFAHAGMCIGGTVWTAATKAPAFTDFSAFVGQAKAITLGDVVHRTTEVPASFYLDDECLQRWQYLKGAKAVDRVTAEGFAYTFTEGGLAFPDALDKPSRTVITGEGGAAASRTKHVVRTAEGRLRRLVPEELEELNGFPRGFTQAPGVTDVKRAFMMGNALVMGVVACIGAAMLAVHGGKPLDTLVKVAPAAETQLPLFDDGTGTLEKLLSAGGDAQSNSPLGGIDIETSQSIRPWVRRDWGRAKSPFVPIGSPPTPNMPSTPY